MIFNFLSIKKQNSAFSYVNLIDVNSYSRYFFTPQLKKNYPNTPAQFKTIKSKNLVTTQECGVSGLCQHAGRQKSSLVEFVSMV